MQFSAPDNYLGKNQSWQDVTALRAIDVTYTNTTGASICIAIVTELNAAHYFYVDGEAVIPNLITYNYDANFVVIVPHGSTYKKSGGSFKSWKELK